MDRPESAKSDQPGATSASRVREAVSNSGRSVPEIAQAAGVSRSTLYRVVSEGRAPSINLLFAVAPVLGVPVSALLPDLPAATDPREARLLDALRASPPNPMAVREALAAWGVLMAESADAARPLGAPALQRVERAARTLADVIAEVIASADDEV